MLPQKLRSLNSGEEELREKALSFISDDARLILHLSVVEQAMDLCDLLRQFESDDEDFKVIQIFGIRIFNALGASLKLALSGYHQNSALILRDVLETVFLLDLFRFDSSKIEKWRLAKNKTERDEFRPIKVRITLDNRDGFKSQKRAELYKLFSELAGHPTMKSVWMLRPQKDGDAVIGPFIEKSALTAVISEMGQLAIQVGGHLSAFFPSDSESANLALNSFNIVQQRWLKTFYGNETPSVGQGQ